MIGTHSVLALITARGGSKGLPGKNIHPVHGRPLIEWTIEAARASRYIDRLILSSDDPKIIEAAARAGCEAPFRRSAALSRDEVGSIDVVLDALARVPGHDVVVLLQPTSPLRATSDIDGVLEMLQSSGAPACVSVRPAQEHPYWTFRLGQDGTLASYVAGPERPTVRRQDLPAAWCLNGAVYAARVEWLLRSHTFIAPQTLGYPMPIERSLDIDTAADLESFIRALSFMEKPADV